MGNIEQHDLFVMLCCMLRYALTRNDGTMLSFENMIQKYGHRLDKSQRQQFISEISEKVQAAGFSSAVFGSIEAQKGWESIAGQLVSMEDIGDLRANKDEVVYMRQNRRLDAIKSIRARTNFGLIEARDLTELWQREPEKYGLA